MEHNTIQYTTPHLTSHNTTQQQLHSGAQHSTVQHSTAQHSSALHSTAQHSAAQCGTAQRSAAMHSKCTAQHGTAQHSTCIITSIVDTGLDICTNVFTKRKLFVKEILPTVSSWDLILIKIWHLCQICPWEKKCGHKSSTYRLLCFLFFWQFHFWLRFVYNLGTKHARIYLSMTKSQNSPWELHGMYKGTGATCTIITYSRYVMNSLFLWSLLCWECQHSLALPEGNINQNRKKERHKM